MVPPRNPKQNDPLQKTHHTHTGCTQKMRKEARVVVKQIDDEQTYFKSPVRRQLQKSDDDLQMSSYLSSRADADGFR